MYFTDRGIEELDDRRGDEQVSIGWLAGRLRDYVDEHPEADTTIDSLASWLARLDDDDLGLFEESDGPGPGSAAFLGPADGPGPGSAASPGSAAGPPPPEPGG